MRAIVQYANGMSESQKQSMYQLRGKIFKDRLNWRVSVDADGESDKFDHQSTIYSTVSSVGSVVACTRLLKTTGAYMLKDIFPNLARGEDIPEQDDIFEISRFAIDKACNRDFNGMVSNLTYEIFQSLYYFAVERNISSYVIVTTVAAEKIMKLMGLPIRRFGDGKETLIGSTRSVGLYLYVNKKYAESVGN